MIAEVNAGSVHTELLEQLPVSMDATTSRMVVNNPLLRVVYFAFDTGQELTDHSSPRAVVVQLLTGAIEFTVEEATHSMRPGDAVYLAPGQVHALKALAPSHLSLVMVDVPKP